MSSKKANTVFQVKPRRIKLITLAYVPGALHTVLAFLDDMLVLGSDFQSHLTNLKHVFEHFRQYQLKLKPRKCVLFKKTVDNAFFAILNLD
jgi:hypothetical protein